MSEITITFKNHNHYILLQRDIAGDLSKGENIIRKVDNEVFNVGSTEQNYQKQQLVELIRPYAPDAEIEYIHRDEDPRDYRVSFAKIENQLGFKITRTVEDGIREVTKLVGNGIIQNYHEARYRN